MMKSRELFVGGLNVFMWMITADGTVLNVPVADIHIGEFDELRIGGMSTREESFVFLEAAGAGAPALAEAEVDGGRAVSRATAPARALRAHARSTGFRESSGTSALSAGTRRSRRTSSRSEKETNARSPTLTGLPRALWMSPLTERRSPMSPSIPAQP